MDAQVATLFNQHNPHIRMDLRGATFVRSLRQRYPFKLDNCAAVGGGASAFSIRPMLPDEFEILDFSRVLNIFPNREGALIGGRL
jgi:hypothetical protein